MPFKQKVYPADISIVFPVAACGRPRKDAIPDVTLVSAQATLEAAKWRQVSWRRGTKGKLSACFAAVRVRVADGPPQRIHDMGAQHLPGEEVWLIGGTSFDRRTQVLPLQPVRGHANQTTGRCHQSSLGLRTAPSATQGRARPGPLRGAVMERFASTRADVHDCSRLPSVPSAQASQRGKKESRATAETEPAVIRQAIIDRLTRPPDKPCPHCGCRPTDLPSQNLPK